ncbi:transcription termination factor NusA [bacterium]|nr:transcription termination factor NusA [bacterium]
MINPILDAFGEIAREKSISQIELIEMIEAGLVAAVRKRYGANCEVKVQIEPREGRIRIQVGRHVVETVEDTTAQVALEEAQRIDPKIALEGILWNEVPFSDFGRNAIQAAKQVVIQRIREAERDKIRSEYSGKIGELLSGTIQQVERGNYVVFLNRQTEAIMPMKETNRKDHFKQGDPVRACLIDIRETTKGPQLILSRTHESFLKALFQLEVPEIYQGIIDIRGVVREAGSRAKIAVYSHDDHIDAVGACVGLKGSRVQAVVNELGGERIDIIPFSDEPQEYVRAALNPAKIYRTSINREDGQVNVVIEDDQLSLAIGKNGQNVRLASKLTGWKIELMTKKDFMAQRDEGLAGIFGPKKPASDESAAGEGSEKEPVAVEPSRPEIKLADLFAPKAPAAKAQEPKAPAAKAPEPKAPVAKAPEPKAPMAKAPEPEEEAPEEESVPAVAAAAAVPEQEPEGAGPEEGPAVEQEEPVAEASPAATEEPGAVEEAGEEAGLETGEEEYESGPRRDLEKLGPEQQELIDNLPVEDFPLNLIEAISGNVREKLEEAGYDSFYQLVLADLEELSGVKGIGRKTATRVKEIVDYLVEHYSEEEED